MLELHFLIKAAIFSGIAGLMVMYAYEAIKQLPVKNFSSLTDAVYNAVIRTGVEMIAIASLTAIVTLLIIL